MKIMRGRNLFFVAFLSSALTAFGDTNCTPAPSGLVAWWRAENNPDDSVGANNGTIVGGVSYASGEVGQAFRYDGSSGYISVAASPSLDVVAGNGLTIECWIKPDHLGPVGANGRPIVEWDDPGTVGTMLWFENQYTLVGNLRDLSGGDHIMQSAPGTINTNTLQHVVETYDKASGDAALYINGVQVVSTNFGTIRPQTSVPLYLGIRAANGYPGSGSLYNGLLDEVSIYNRALSQSEIQAIYNAGRAGKCPVSGLAPTIVNQPTNQTVAVGASASFSVGATGTPPLTYQWYNGSGSITGGTNSTLTLNNVQLSDAGGYYVVVANPYGSTNSATATLTVTNPPPPPTNCTPAPSGLVAWWQAENNPDDSVGANNGTIVGGVSYASGEVGQAFRYDGSSGYISVAASPSLDVVAGNGLTIECWIKPDHLGPVGANGRPIVEWDDPGTVGTMLWFENQYTLVGNLRDLSGGDHIMQSAPGTINTNTLQHVVETYDKASGDAALYINGVQVVSTNFGTIRPQTSVPLYLGIRAANGYPGSGSLYNGLLDEVSIYNRALSQSEIQAIYNAGRAGKCPVSGLAPTIVNQPTNQTVAVGASASFSVGATGTPPLSYQWYNGSGSIIGGTNSTLTLNNVQLSDAGGYYVVVANPYGSTNSATATLTVTNPPPPPTNCTPAPSGLVAWWRAENNPDDSVGANNGTIVGGVSYASGEVGQAFRYDGTSGYISVAASPSLDVGAGNGLTIECWIKPDHLGPVGANGRPIVEWDDPGTVGTMLWFENQYTLVGNLRDLSGGDHIMQSAPGTINTNSLQHVVETYDKASGDAALYINGVQVVSTNFGTIRPQTSVPLYLGIRAANGYPGSGSLYNGLLDEVSIYNRAWSQSELQAIYNAGSAGKCPASSNQPPVAYATATTTLVISPNGSNAPVSLDGSLSYDTDGDPLQYEWFEGTQSIGSGEITTAVLPVGTNEITLAVSDGMFTNEQTIAVDVITVSNAIEQLSLLVETNVSKAQSLAALLANAINSVDRSNPMAAINQLQAFQNQVNAQIAPLDPALAQILITDAQNIINVLSGVATKSKDSLPLFVRIAHSQAYLGFSGVHQRSYSIESSTDLK